MLKTIDQIFNAPREIMVRNVFEFRNSLIVRFFNDVVMPYQRIKRIGLQENAIKQAKG